jgi:hypothetical protein
MEGREMIELGFGFFAATIVSVVWGVAFYLLES